MKKITSLLPALSLILAALACSLPSAAPAEPDATATPPVSTPTVVETPSTLDSCLIGVWTMDAYALNNKLLDLTGSPSLSVIAPSQMTMQFNDDNTFAISGQTTVRFDIPGGTDYIEMAGAHAGQGIYTADGVSLNITTSNYGVEYGTMRAFINGESQDVPAGAVPPMPEDALAPPASAGYSCSESSLEISYAGITEVWSR